MKKSICILLTLIMVFSLAGCGDSVEKAVGETSATFETTAITTTESAKPEQTENPDFRNAKWGMAKDEVKLSESLVPVDEDETGVMYSPVKVSNFSASLVFFFNSKGKLSNACYFFSESHMNDNLYIDDYNSLVNALTEKYGEPKANMPMWKNDLFKDDEDNWGLAIASGHLVYCSSWELGDTTIYLLLRGDNFKISMSLLYESTKYKEENKTSIEGL